jgi:hypothetical protein
MSQSAWEGGLKRVGERLAQVWRENWLFLLIVGGIVAAFLALRTTASPVDSVGEVDAILTGGQPTVVEFYSNV